MAQWKAMGSGVVLAGLVAGGAAQADVTADQVWQNWKDLATIAGETITVGLETKAGGTLSLHDVKITAKPKDGTVTASIAEIDLKEVAGSVEITLSPEIPVAMTIAPETGGRTDLDLTLSQSGFKIVASGTPDDSTFAVSGDSFGAKLVSLKTDGKDQGSDASAVLSGLKGTYHLTGTGDRHSDSTLSAAKLAISVSLKNAETDGTFHLDANAADLSSQSKAAMVAGVDMKDMAAALRAGFGFDGGIDLGAMSYSWTYAEKDQTAQGSGGSDTSSLTFAMDKSRLQYGAKATGSHVTVSGSQLPVPSLDLKVAESAFNLLIPTLKSDTPQDFSLLARLSGLAANDDLWAMIDPTKALPHDPATLIVDLAGKANWLFDFLDPAQAAHPPAVPGELHALTVKQVELQAAGADLSATGDLTFDNSGGRLDGMPRPSGVIDLRLVGGNGLLDKLVKMGLVPDDQAMGTRMMLGMFAKPGEGADTLVSKIELNKDGSITANGQRIK